MKKVVSISLGSSTRDHEVITNMLGQQISIKRIGVDGDLKAARAMLCQLDHEVDVFGLGGCEFGINFNEKYYPLRSIASLTNGLTSPVVDGSGVRSVVERAIGGKVAEILARANQDKRVLCCVASARYDLVLGFHEAGFKIKFGDPGFILGIPFTSQSFWLARQVGRIFIPMVVRAPFSWLYPTGKKQLVNQPKFQKWFDWATVIADDFHYIKRRLPEKIDGKIIVTNTTTSQDREMLRERGAKYLITSTPLFEGRSFGTNVFEAALTAATEKQRVLTEGEIRTAIDEVGFKPQLTQLN